MPVAAYGSDDQYALTATQMGARTNICRVSVFGVPVRRLADGRGRGDRVGRPDRRRRRDPAIDGDGGVRSSGNGDADDGAIGVDGHGRSRESGGDSPSDGDVDFLRIHGGGQRSAELSIIPSLEKRTHGRLGLFLRRRGGSDGEARGDERQEKRMREHDGRVL